MHIDENEMNDLTKKRITREKMKIMINDDENENENDNKMTKN